jgi:PAS domain S-box-containing protein
MPGDDSLANLPEHKPTIDSPFEQQGDDIARYWLSAIIESAEDAIITKTLDGVITSWNKGAERIFGYTADEVLGRPVTILFPPDHIDEEPAILARLRRGERVEHYETVRRHKDGTLLDISLTVSPIMGPEGRVIGASKIARDITARKRAEEALRQREEELTDFIENSAVGLHWVAADGTILWANQAELDLLGYTREEYVGHHIAEFHADREAIADILARLTRDETLHSYEARLRCKDGSIRYVLISSNVRRRDGEFVHTRCFTRDITERRQAEESLRLYGRVLDSMVEGVSVSDEQGFIIYTNPAENEMFGYERGELVGRHVTVLNDYSSEENERIVGEVIEQLKAKGFWSGEWSNRRKDGTPFTTFARITALDISGRKHWVCVQEDVTERKRAAAELRATEHRFTMFMENLPGLAWIKNLEGRYIYANEAAVRAFGIERSKLYGRTDEDVFPPETAAQFRENDRRALEGGAGVQSVEVLEQEDGLHYSLVSKFPILAPESGQVLVGGVAVDITEQQRAENALRSSEARLRALFAAMTDIVLVLGGDGRYLEIAPTNPRLLYKPPAELIGRTLQDVLPPEQADFFLGHVRRALQTRQPHTVEYELHIGTEEVWFEASVSPMTEEAVFWIARDVTEHKRAEEERERLLASEQKARAAAEETSRLKDEFLAIISHELRTPLTAIVGWATMLRTNNFDESSTAKALETIERNARAQTQLIEDLMDVSRIITGKLRLDVRQVEVAPIVEAAVDAVRPAADAKNIRLQMVLDPLAGPVSGDPVRLQQVVWNLVSNAVKFTPKGGRVQIRLARVNSHVEISVNDTGAGIPPEFLPHVFDRFRQADQKTTRQHGGMGLGLSIVRHLVELHGGTVEAESPGEGLGATFTVLLPVAPVYRSVGVEERVHPAAKDTLPSYECPDRLDGLRVLVVDDEPDTRELLKTGLGQCGAEVMTAGSAGEALEAIRRVVPDVLISDIGMPEEDGYELIRRVRELPAEGGGRVPAIALTAYARVEDRMQALRAGYEMHVPKPVELAELVAVAASLVRRAR